MHADFRSPVREAESLQLARLRRLRALAIQDGGNFRLLRVSWDRLEEMLSWPTFVVGENGYVFCGARVEVDAALTGAEWRAIVEL